MTTNQLNDNEFDSYYSRYINKLKSTVELRKGFKTQSEALIDFFNSIPEEKLDFRYEKHKWTVKEILQHLIDTERIFIYRCFRIAQ